MYGTTAIALILAAMGGMNTVLQSFFLLLILDFVTGIFGAYKRGEIESHKMWKGAMKMISYLIAVVLGNQMDIIFYGESGVPHDLMSFKYYILSYLAFTQMVSITENLTLLGVPVPPAIVKKLKASKDKIEAVEV